MIPILVVVILGVGCLLSLYASTQTYSNDASCGYACVSLVFAVMLVALVISGKLS